MENSLSKREALLHKFWQRTNNGHSEADVQPTSEEWSQQVLYLSQSGKGIEEALRYLYSMQPSYETFMEWLQPVNIPAETGSQVYTGNVLTVEDRDFWDRNGYVVVKNAVSAEDCAAARAAIWEYLGADPAIPESWYELHEGKNGMMLSFFQHPALNSNRHAPKIRKAYEELYDGKNIYMLMDKVSFNPPETASYNFIGSRLHWDVSLQLPIPFILQGLLYLNDVGAADGAFHCVPGFHKQIGTWLNSLPQDADPRRAALTELTPVPVPGNTGDLVIWHQALPHCATPNKGSVARMVQYITYKPVDTPDNPVWI